MTLAKRPPAQTARPLMEASQHGNAKVTTLKQRWHQRKFKEHFTIITIFKIMERFS